MGKPSLAAANVLGDTTDNDAADGTTEPEPTPRGRKRPRSQADDPVSQLGDLSAFPSELGDTDPYAADWEPEESVLPEGFDVFRVKQGVIDRMRQADKDPTVVRINVVPVVGGRRRRTIKKLRPEGLTYARLRDALAPGTYDVQGFNEDGIFMGGRRIRVDREDVDDLDELDELDGLPSGGGGRRGRGNMGDRLLYALAMKGIRGGESQGRSSELSSAIGDFAKLLTLQAQASSATVQAQLKAMEVDARRSRSESSSQLSTFKTMVELFDRRAPKRGNSGTKTEEVLGLLQLGMQFRDAMDGKNPSDSDELRKWVLPLVDSLGPQLVGLLAMALPKDKAELLSDLLEQHMRTQEARAQGGVDPDPIDTPGEEVPTGEK